MITMLAIGIGFLVVLAILVGVVDATHASAWRRVAAERRQKWEARQPEYHGIDTNEYPVEDDD